ncbi:MAG: hydrogen gas-evolving membrane-bound hydrogenase subunit E, partial [Corynebacterium sp.]|nr:hydrogen gas-evolving membrane-bound hydrogenase subunit E [Corynebacterium sp.]
GFGTTLWFYGLGAADVATTQLTVEILTVCVLVLVLHRLPDHFTPETRRFHWWSIVLAVVMGICTFIATWGLTGRRDKSAAARLFLDQAYFDTGGTNIVNTILVDYRAFDTFGELTVLGMAGISIAVLLHKFHLAPVRETLLDRKSPIFDAVNNSVFLRVTTRIVGPIIIFLSILLFFRGHYETGGGFVAALVGSGGVALLYLSAPSRDRARIRWPYFLLIGSGIAIASLTGMAGYFEGSFLTSLHAEILGTHQTSAMIFDLGVYLAVIGVVIGAFNMLGMPRAGDKEFHVLMDIDRERKLENIKSGQTSYQTLTPQSQATIERSE